MNLYTDQKTKVTSVLQSRTNKNVFNSPLNCPKLCQIVAECRVGCSRFVVQRQNFCHRTEY